MTKIFRSLISSLFLDDFDDADVNDVELLMIDI